MGRIHSFNIPASSFLVFQCNCIIQSLFFLLNIISVQGLAAATALTRASYVYDDTDVVSSAGASVMQLFSSGRNRTVVSICVSVSHSAVNGDALSIDSNLVT